MAKKKLLKSKKSGVFFILMLLVIFFLLSLIIPAIGAGPTSPTYWTATVGFFVSVQAHFVAYWMFYSFGAVVLFAYYANGKK